MECFSSPDALKDDTCGGTRIKQTRATPPESEPSVEQEAPLPNTELEFKFKLGKVEGEGEEPEAEVKYTNNHFFIIIVNKKLIFIIFVLFKSISKMRKSLIPFGLSCFFFSLSCCPFLLSL